MTIHIVAHALSLVVSGLDLKLEERSDKASNPNVCQIQPPSKAQVLFLFNCCLNIVSFLSPFNSVDWKSVFNAVFVDDKLIEFSFGDSRLFLICLSTLLLLSLGCGTVATAKRISVR